MMISNLYHESPGENLQQWTVVGKCSRCCKSYSQDWIHLIGGPEHVRVYCEKCNYPIVASGGNARQTYFLSTGTSYIEHGKENLLPGRFESFSQSIKTHISTIAELNPGLQSSIDSIGFRYHDVWEGSREDMSSSKEYMLMDADSSQAEIKKSTKDKREKVYAKVSGTDIPSDDLGDVPFSKFVGDYAVTPSVNKRNSFEEDEKNLDRVTFSKENLNTRSLALPSTTLNRISALFEKNVDSDQANIVGASLANEAGYQGKARILQHIQSSRSLDHSYSNTSIHSEEKADPPVDKLASGGRSAVVSPSALLEETASLAAPNADSTYRIGLTRLESGLTRLRWRCVGSWK